MVTNVALPKTSLRLWLVNRLKMTNDIKKVPIEPITRQLMAFAILLPGLSLVFSILAFVRDFVLAAIFFSNLVDIRCCKLINFLQ